MEGKIIQDGNTFLEYRPGVWFKSNGIGKKFDYTKCEECGRLVAHVLGCFSRHIKMHNKQKTLNHEKITCVETGETFKSCKEAATHFKIPQSSLSHHLHERTGFEDVHGKTFKFIDH